MNYNEYLKLTETRRKLASKLYAQYKDEIPQIEFEIPKRLFKYSKINEYVIDNLEKEQFTLSCPNLFNDYYDAAIHRNSFESYFADELKRQDLLKMCGLSTPENIEVEKMKKEAEHEDRFLSQYMKEVFRVGCLSGDNSSILMWSHYADDNRGICIEYDLTDTTIVPFMYPVVYVPYPFDCSELSEKDIDLAMLASTIVKFNIWSYEEEWRILLYYPTLRNEIRRERISSLFPKPKAIYLGRGFLEFWINQKKKKKDGVSLSLFTRLCENIKKNNIDLYVMKNKIMSYELYPVKIDIDLVQSLSEGRLYEEYLV